MTTITHKILCENVGEQLHTWKSPQAVWTGQVDLNTEHTYILSSSDHRLTAGKAYEVREYELPAWLDAQEWCDNYFDWGIVLGSFGLDVDQKLAYWLLNLSAEQVAAVKSVMTKKTKSSFVLSIREQIQNWISNGVTASPLSQRQLMAIMPKDWTRRR
jgi:hypothetical protein